MDTSKIKEISQGVVEVRNKGDVVWGGEVPGPKQLIGGNLQAGFFGEVPAHKFITGDELARLIGLTVGKSQYSSEPWLKFAYMGKIEFVAKKPFRYGISWDSINSANAITGSRTVQIKGKTYKIRLIKGKTEGKQADQGSYQGDINKGSEWNKLLLPIHERAPSNWRYFENVKSPTEDWGVKYSDDDLITNNANGSYSWCQEYGESSAHRLLRGYGGVASSISLYSSSHAGWRPVLELVK